MISVQIIGTGSAGNCAVVNHDFMVDLGVSRSLVEHNAENLDALRHISAAFITHEHNDHANPSLVKCLYEIRPDVFKRQFFIPAQTYEKLAKANSFLNKAFEDYPLDNIINKDSEFDFRTRGGKWHVRCFHAPHGSAECVGFVFTSPEDETLFWATDIENLNFAGVGNAKYDAICCEGNWDTQALTEALKDPETAGHAESSLRHQSVEAFEKFVSEHAKANGKIIQLHNSNSFGRYSRYNNVYPGDVPDYSKPPLDI